MKSISIALFMLFIANAHADIEATAGDAAQVSSQEITKNRACFSELSKQGCGDPGEDIKKFRTCLHDSFAQLSENCQTMMTNLYGKKK
jgi:hypothetical protein